MTGPLTVEGAVLHRDGRHINLIDCCQFTDAIFCSRRPSPSYENGHSGHAPNDESEARSVFVSQLAARMAARDLGFFFEEHLGEGSVIDPRIVTDRLSRRSKG